jgi:hypothetical protein
MIYIIIPEITSILLRWTDLKIIHVKNKIKIIIIFIKKKKRKKSTNPTSMHGQSLMVKWDDGFFYIKKNSKREEKKGKLQRNK